MQFEYYVLNWDVNQRKVINFNIFRNHILNDAVEKQVKKYLRSPKKYTHIGRDNETTCGFKALCNEINSLIMWQEWARCEYEIAVGSIFSPEVYEVLEDLNNYINNEKEDIHEFKKYLETLNSRKKYLEILSNRTSRLEKWDCYRQALPNIEMITRELIYQYKQYRKGDKNVS